MRGAMHGSRHALAGVSASVLPVSVRHMRTSHQNESLPICLSGAGMVPSRFHFAHVERVGFPYSALNATPLV